MTVEKHAPICRGTSRAGSSTVQHIPARALEVSTAPTTHPLRAKTRRKSLRCDIMCFRCPASYDQAERRPRPPFQARRSVQETSSCFSEGRRSLREVVVPFIFTNSSQCGRGDRRHGSLGRVSVSVVLHMSSGRREAGSDKTQEMESSP